MARIDGAVTHLYDVFPARRAPRETHLLVLGALGRKSEQNIVVVAELAAVDDAQRILISHRLSIILMYCPSPVDNAVEQCADFRLQTESGVRRAHGGCIRCGQIGGVGGHGLGGPLSILLCCPLLIADAVGGAMKQRADFRLQIGPGVRRAHGGCIRCGQIGGVGHVGGVGDTLCWGGALRQTVSLTRSPRSPAAIFSAFSTDASKACSQSSCSCSNSSSLSTSSFFTAVSSFVFASDVASRRATADLLSCAIWS